MKKLVPSLLVLLLSACASVTPHHSKVNNDDLNVLSDCAHIKTQLDDANKKLSELKTQKKASNAGDTVTAAAALLSLNPFALLDVTQTGELDESIVSYESRVTTLQKLHIETCSDNK